MKQQERTRTLPLAMLFSDIDGTLVHYVHNESVPARIEPGVIESVHHATGAVAEGIRDRHLDNRLLHLPPTSSGLEGYISSRTLRLCRDVRRKCQSNGETAKLVLISGARASTLLQRIPYLPRADAYCCESGGRIFYPVRLKTDQDARPVVGGPYNVVDFDGATNEDRTAFSLVEDLTWRSIVMRRSGSADLDDQSVDNHPLWDLARQLEDFGFALDRQSYETCFRINKKHQPTHMIPTFEKLLLVAQRNGDHRPYSSRATDPLVRFPAGIASSTNLGAIDFYPDCSGKRNW
jgi:hypothetical protein